MIETGKREWEQHYKREELCQRVEAGQEWELKVVQGFAGSFGAQTYQNRRQSRYPGGSRKKQIECGWGARRRDVLQVGMGQECV